MEHTREKREEKLDRGPAPEAASGRAAMYGLLLDVFAGLPGRALVCEIEEGRFDGLGAALGELGVRKLDAGAGLIASYRSRARSRGSERALHDLSVDRTRLLGMTGDRGLKPPYERLYASGPHQAVTVLVGIRDFYRKAGLLLGAGTREPSDFLFVELDFMRLMCLREIGAWSSGADSAAIRALEHRFLCDHPARWAGVYCVEAQRYARTDFYRGFLAVLDGFLESEEAYLEGARWTGNDETKNDKVFPVREAALGNAGADDGRL